MDNFLPVIYGAILLFLFWRTYQEERQRSTCGQHAPTGDHPAAEVLDHSGKSASSAVGEPARRRGQEWTQGSWSASQTAVFIVIFGICYHFTYKACSYDSACARPAWGPGCKLGGLLTLGLGIWGFVNGVLLSD